MNISLAGKLIT